MRNILNGDRKKEQMFKLNRVTLIKNILIYIFHHNIILIVVSFRLFIRLKNGYSFSDECECGKLCIV